MTRAATATLVATLILTACHPSHPAIRTCADPLGGVWKDPQGRAWQIIDRAKLVEIYPLFDTSVEPPIDSPAEARAPIQVALPRRGEAVDGEASFRLSRPGEKPCVVKYPFRVTGCAGRRATLSYQEVTAVSPGCSAAYGPLWNDVPIVRE